MNVGELRATLAGLPEEMPVVLARDAEGNGFSPASEVAKEFWIECDREVVHPEDAPEYDDLPYAAVLWPV